MTHARLRLWAVLAPSLLAAAAAAVSDGEGRTARPSAAEPEFLAELRLRRIVAPEAAAWTPGQYTEALRAREAEALGAFALLRAKFGTLRGLAAEQPTPKGYKRLLLTKEGYARFIFALSQDARAYFEREGAQAKEVFALRSVAGEPLFDEAGLLTQEGISVTMAVRRGVPAFWKLAGGGVTGTARPTPEVVAAARASGRAAKPAAGLPPPPGAGAAPAAPADDEAAKKRVAELMRSGYLEVSESEYAFLLKATKLDEGRLRAQSSLQVIPTQGHSYRLIAPSDPLMALVARYRVVGE